MTGSNVFIQSEWISQGKQWNEVPARVKRAVKQSFAVPLEHGSSIFPAKVLSVKQMMDFALPSPVQSLAANSIAPASYFSRTAPAPVSEALLVRLRHLPTPPIPTIKKLLEAGHQAALDGFESVRCVHIADTVTTHFPLWVVTYWVDVSVHQPTVRTPWNVSLKWSQCERQQKVSQERRDLAEDVGAVLHTLPWGLTKTGASGAEPIHVMAKYLGSSWTIGGMVCGMLDELADRIAADPFLDQQLVVYTPALSTKILEAYTFRETNNYANNPSFRWIHRIAEDIVHKCRSVLTMHHLGDDYPHWVAVVIDGSALKIRYGDSFHNTIPADLCSAYEWWLSRHSPSSFEPIALPTGKQEDTFECGFFAENALEHHTFPSDVPLITSSGARVLRMKSFLCMSRKILSSSVSVSFVNEHLFDTHILCQIMPNNMLLETDVSSASLLAQSENDKGWNPCEYIV